ncbi:hypothetical protein ABW20_dc0103282 [Dactylellina cionopaga]|nr:hypothetical protein ABW20_dc0103282 [Dactylellina cionopaga]
MPRKQAKVPVKTPRPVSRCQETVVASKERIHQSTLLPTSEIEDSSIILTTSPAGNVQGTVTASKGESSSLAGGLQRTGAASNGKDSPRANKTQETIAASKGEISSLAGELQGTVNSLNEVKIVVDNPANVQLELVYPKLKIFFLSKEIERLVVDLEPNCSDADLVIDIKARISPLYQLDTVKIASLGPDGKSEQSLTLASATEYFILHGARAKGKTTVHATIRRSDFMLYIIGWSEKVATLILAVAAFWGNRWGGWGILAASVTFLVYVITYGMPHL